MNERVFLNPAGSHWAPFPTAPTSAEIYAMCCESDLADQFAMWLCAMAGVEYPPKNDEVTQ